MCEIKDLYLMMGKEFETLDEVPAGNMIGKFLLSKFNFMMFVKCLYYFFLFVSARRGIFVKIKVRFFRAFLCSRCKSNRGVGVKK